jgi:hypothetical protein
LNHARRATVQSGFEIRKGLQPNNRAVRHFGDTLSLQRRTAPRERYD